MNIFLAATLSGHIADQCGRKMLLMIASFAFGLSYIKMIYATEVVDIYAARIVQGIGSGFTMTVVPMYIGEVATKESRGSTGSVLVLFMAIGMLFVYVIGPYTRYVVMQICCLALPIISIGCFIYIPESPHFLVSKDRLVEAAKALQMIRGQSFDAINDEIKEIRDMTERMRKTTRGRIADLFLHPGNRRALVTVLGLMFFQQLSGVVVIVINSQSIFMDADSSLDAALSSIIVGISQVLFSTILELIVDKYKRRTLLRFSAAGMCAADFVIGTYFYVHVSSDTTYLRWVPIVALVLFSLSYRMGFGPMPFAMLGEMFPQNIKSIAATTVTVTCWSLAFIVAYSYPWLDVYGTYYIFWGFSISCMFAFFFVQFVVIETFSLSLAEIQDQLQNIE